MEKITEQASINGSPQNIEFSPMGISEYTLIENAVRADSIKFLKDKIVECGLEPDKRFVAWRDARPDRVKWQDVIAFVHTPAGIQLVLNKSMELSGVDETTRTQAINSYLVPDAANLCMALLGFADRMPLKVSVLPLKNAPDGGAHTSSGL